MIKNEQNRPQNPQDKQKDPAVLFDIDGTLALMNRSCFDFDKVDQDIVWQPVLEMLYNMKFLGHQIILITGRDAEAKPKTLKWLEDNEIPYNEIHFRDKGNNEKDFVIKKALYEEHIKPYYDVRFIFDDRNQVVNMWRTLGLPCFQVYYGDF